MAARFRREADEAVLVARDASRAEAVPVEASTHHITVRVADRSGTVPRFLQGSMEVEKQLSSSLGMAGGIISNKDSSTVRPALVYNSREASKFAESDLEASTTGPNWSGSTNSQDRSGSSELQPAATAPMSAPAANARDTIQFTLPRIVLISPLCAIWRNGWANDQRGIVFVENRRW